MVKWKSILKICGKKEKNKQQSEELVGVASVDSQPEEVKIDVQTWLDQNYPQENRAKIEEVYLNEPNLVGELDLEDFTYWSGVKVYIYPTVDASKLVIKSQSEKTEIIKLVNAQEWLNANYPQEGMCNRETDDKIKEYEGLLSNEGWNNKGKTRTEITKLEITHKLEGDLDLSDFINLKELNCCDNKLTILNLSDCSQLEKIICHNNRLINLILPTNPTNLKILSLSTNNFSTQNLSFLVPYTNLEVLGLGNYGEENFNQGIYNKFIGSLSYLDGMKQLKVLDISRTDISEVDITKLPTSLVRIEYLTEGRPTCKLTEIVPLFKN